MKLRILLYRAGRDGKWLDNAISGYTHLFNWWTEPYSHAEVQKPDENRSFIGLRQIDGKPLENGDYGPRFVGTCYTSTTRGDNKGTVKRPASEVLKHVDRWDYCDVEIDDRLYPLVIAYLDDEVANNKGYGFKQILTYFWFRTVHSKDKNICSELVYDALCVGGIFKKKNLCPSPRKLSTLLRKSGYEIRSLATGELR
jgi:hypothetical protein